MQKKQTRNIIIAVVILCLLAAAALTAYLLLRPTGEEGAKTIGVAVIVGGETRRSLEINTDAEYLRGALEEKELIQGDESTFGLYVKTVDGVTADESKNEFWSFTKAGVFLETGVDDTPILDGDKFEITLSVW
ncbi:MAG: DUF4430 domain-containing protein [Oscillospiraceae bacterium]|jgi:hypothetical protein|nr:DUF4430 domain-containing protein [Oscillospiraceae bacterium]